MALDKTQGTIKLLNEKGFGFIAVEGFEKDVFFHAKDLRHITFERIRKGDTVTIGSITKNDKGFTGTDICLIS